MKTAFNIVKNNQGIDFFQAGFSAVNSEDKILFSSGNKKSGKFYTHNKNAYSGSILIKDHSACYIFILRKLVIENELFFIKDRLHEDVEWKPRLLLCANTLYLLKQNFYRYLFHRASSIRDNYSIKNFLDALKSAEENWARVDSAKVQNNLKKQLKKFIGSSIITHIPTIIRKLDKHEIREIVKLFSKNKTIIQNSSLLNQKMFITFTRIFGINIAIKMVAIMCKFFGN
jgi:hypothetical protein